MPKKGLKLSGNWNTFANLIHPGKFAKRMEKEVGRAVARSGKVAERAMRRQISGKKLTKNAALTEAIKGANNPLVDGSELFKAITSKSLKWNKVFAGVLRTDSVFNIAKLLHEGKDIAVTQKMRNLFWLLWLASLGRPLPGGGKGRAAELFARFQDWKPLSPSTRVIRIPARPFAAQAMEDDRLIQSVEIGWPLALQRALTPK